MPTRFDHQRIADTTPLPEFIRRVNDRFARIAQLWNGFTREDAAYVFDAAFLELKELAADPDAPAVDCVRLYAKDVGGKTALFARFNTGAVRQIEIEP